MSEINAEKGSGFVLDGWFGSAHDSQHKAQYGYLLCGLPTTISFDLYLFHSRLVFHCDNNNNCNLHSLWYRFLFY